LLLQEFSAVMDKIAARGSQESFGEESFAEALAVGGEIQPIQVVNPSLPKAELQSSVDTSDSKTKAPALSDENKNQAFGDKPRNESEQHLTQEKATTQEAPKSAETQKPETSAANVKEAKLSKQDDNATAASQTTQVTSSATQDVEQEVLLAGEGLGQNRGQSQAQSQVKASPKSSASEKQNNAEALVAENSTATPAPTQETGKAPTEVQTSEQNKKLNQTLTLGGAGEVTQDITSPISFEVARMTAEVLALKYALEKSTASVLQTAQGKMSVETAAHENQASIAPSSGTGTKFGSSDGAIGGRLSTQAQKEEQVRSSKQLPQALSTRTMERVETALKEAAKARDGKTISLRLDPPDLGKVKVDVTLRDGALHARIVVESPAVNQLLREKSHELQQNLRRLGLEVDTVTVTVSSDGQSNFNSGEFVKQNSSENLKEFGGGLLGKVSNQNVAHTEVKTQAAVDGWVA
jgi:flagellar hook-length control protein FliK